ncbi:hypothetical protein R1flu_027802 [Riccia fluitans]|uniref:Uncharacterized protein n=1 Tax=Riccia fluitans TaxID=41844 RepID=A0ABD1XJV9_9MARC
MPSPALLAAYGDFDRALLGILEALLGTSSFASTEGCLAMRQVSLPQSLGGLGLPSMVHLAASAFLSSGALVAFALLTRFQWNDQSYLMQEIAQVETGQFPF